jgi:hypothetical protein
MAAPRTALNTGNGTQAALNSRRLAGLLSPLDWLAASRNPGLSDVAENAASTAYPLGLLELLNFDRFLFNAMNNSIVVRNITILI